MNEAGLKPEIAAPNSHHDPVMPAVGMARLGVVWARIWVVLCIPWLSGIKTLPFDAVQQFFPAVGFTAAQLRQLQAPWWNPYLYGGYPQAADPQMMSFQPGMVLPMLLAPQSLYWFNVVVLLHVLVGGLGALHLARHYRLHPAASLLFALVMMFGGVAASRLQHTPMIISYCLLPWLWLSLSRLRHEGRWRDALMLGVFGGLCALQLTQLTWLIALGCALYFVFAVLLGPGRGLRFSPARRIRLRLQFLLAAVLAAVLSAPQWISTLAWLTHTNRVGLSLQAAEAGALPWQALATLLSGNLFSQARGESWAFGDISTSYLYCGVVPLALWLLWGGEVSRRQPWRTRAVLLIVLLAIVYALGDRTPVFAALFDLLPGMNLFRRPADALFITVPAIAWLAAQALHLALQSAPLRPHWPTAGVLGGLLLLALFLIVEAQRPVALLWLSLSALLGLLALACLRARRPGLLLALAVLDLAIFNIGTSFNAASAGKSVLDSARDGPAQEAYRFLSERREPGLPERAAVFGIAALTNGAALHDLPLVNGYNPLLARDYQHMSGMPERPSDGLPAATPWAPDLDAVLHDLLGLRWVLAQQPFAGAQAQGRYLQVLQRDSVLPRVLNPRHVQRHAEALPTPQQWQDTDFEHSLWLAAGVDSACPERDAGRIELHRLHYRPDRVQLQVQADAPAWLVVNEVFAPGWVACIEDRCEPLLRANGLFRAVCLPPGRHELVLRYRLLELWRQAWRSER